jgi:uncharacterized membrane protein HdeD (DUF308 family)
VTSDRWVWAIRGLAGLLLGAAAFGVSTLSLELLLTFMGVYATVLGLATLLGGALPAPGGGVRRTLLAIAMLDLSLGLAVLGWPGASALALLWPVAPAAWALAEGVVLLVATVRLRRQCTSGLLLGASGALSIALCVLLVLPVLPGTDPIVRLVGGYAGLTGALMLGLTRAQPLRHVVQEVPRTGLMSPSCWGCRLRGPAR